MTYRLPAVLTPTDFSEAEMSALVLDGEVYRVGECVSPIDVVPSPLQRAAALRAVLPDKLIVEQRSAAWVWGAVFTPPVRHEVCSDVGARHRQNDNPRLLLREVVINADETVDVAGIRVTVPLRTAIDIARSGEEFPPSDVDTVARLMLFGHFTTEDCALVMERRRNLPNKRVALERLYLAEERRQSISGSRLY